MKYCYLAENAPRLDRVYPPHIKERIQTAFSQGETACYNKEYVLAHPEEFAEVEYIFSTWTMPDFAEEEIRACFPSLRGVMYAAGSVQGFARPFLAAGAEVFSAWAANAIPVAEVACSLILLANKGYHMASRYCSQGLNMRGKANEYIAVNHGNYGCKVGVLGVGMIGTELCRLLSHHNLTVLAFDPFCSPEKAASLGITLTDLKTIFSECEVISNHLADNEATRGMLNYDLFQLMHENTTFINTGRGAQVVEEDLIRALNEKEHSCAILDVTNPEPPVADSPLYGMKNVFLTPHLAGSQRDEWWRMSEYMLEEAVAHRDGKPTRFSVTLKMLETMA